MLGGHPRQWFEIGEVKPLLPRFIRMNITCLSSSRSQPRQLNFCLLVCSQWQPCLFCFFSLFCFKMCNLSESFSQAHLVYTQCIPPMRTWLSIWLDIWPIFCHMKSKTKIKKTFNCSSLVFDLIVDWHCQYSLFCRIHVDQNNWLCQIITVFVCCKSANISADLIVYFPVLLLSNVLTYFSVNVLFISECSAKPS